MVILRWCRVTAVGLFLLTFLVFLAASKSTSNKKELRIRNKREGSWSGWSHWSPCSRTCGSGVRTQTRHCQIRRGRSKSKEVLDESKSWKTVPNRHCEGHATRHHLCNTQECPKGTSNFRESQCKAFDNRKYMGKVYQWEAFIDGRSPCSLTCRAKGYRFLATLDKSVVDGTPCKTTQFDLHVCISGVCTVIGCDGIAGSLRRLDRCGVCGGDNSTCRVVSGIFTRPQLTVGYNMVAHIPRGACNLNITQIRKSPNYLALRKNNGEYIVNGDFRLSRPGEYEGAGAKFQYTRQDVKSLESIASLGPLEEPVDLLVLYQQVNPGIKYEYMLPLSDSPIPPAPIPEPLTSYSHRQQSAATSRPASYIIAPGNLIAPVNENSPSTNNIISFPNPGGFPPSQGVSPLDVSAATNNSPRNQQNPHLYPHTSRRRNPNQKLIGPPNLDKKFYWKITGYSNCSELCGGGTQRSLLRCIRGSNGSPVADRRCQGEEKPIGQTIRCNLKSCPAQWTVGSWTSCSVECGEGIETRTLHCQQRVSPTYTMRVAEAACLDTAPISEKLCFNKPCHNWETSEWSKCSARCGNGIRSRKVICRNGNGEIVESSDCGTSGKPAEISPCNMGPCEGVDWFASEWSAECSQKCGGGLQTRHVVCSGLNSNASDSRQHEDIRPNKASLISSPLLTEALGNSLDEGSGDENETDLLSSTDFFCDESKKPTEERECFTDRNCGEPNWYTGPWSQCSFTCGNGLKTRQVLCVLFNRGKFKVVDNTLCSEASRPEDKAFCSNAIKCPPRWFTSEWTECSSECGGGVQKRSASCRGTNWIKTSSHCVDVDKPIERRSCNEQKCPTSAASITDTSGMVKDHPLKVVQSSERLLSTNSSDTSTRPESVTRYLQSPLQNYSHSLEPNEEPEEGECSDQYRNCPLVVQARLCRYKYYRTVCCSACSDN